MPPHFVSISVFVLWQKQSACHVNFDAYLDMIPIAMDIQKEKNDHA